MYPKKFGKLDQITGQGLRVFVGYCPECHQKHYVTVEEARELVRTYRVDDNITKEKIHLKMPQIKINWI